MSDRRQPLLAIPARAQRAESHLRSGALIALAVCSAGGSGIALSACSFELPKVTGGDTIEIQVTPAGEFRPVDGRELPVDAWRIDSSIAARVIAAFNQRKVPPVLDYEHQTLLKEQNGQPAPAAGWFRALTWRDGQGLYATVELTARAAKAIGDGEYRYFSPVFAYDQVTGAVVSIEMGALTNHPALDSLQPLTLRAAATFGIAPQETTVDPIRIALLAALGLAASATQEQAVAALTALTDERTKLRAALGIDAAATSETAIATCTALRAKADAGPDPAKYVPVSVVEQLRVDIAALTAKQNGSEIDALVNAGLADGRLLPAQEAWARDLGKSNLAALSSYLQTAQPIAALTGSQTRGKPPAGVDTNAALTEQELAVCSATGITAEQFKAARAAA